MADGLSRLTREGASEDGRVSMDGAVNSAAYYRKREQAERTLANRAASSTIRDIHLEMAERYRELAEQVETPTRSRSLA